MQTSPLHRHVLASSSGDHTIRIWNLDEKYIAQPCAVICAGEGHREQVLSIAFHDSSRFLVSGGMDNQVHLWALPDLEKLVVDPNDPVILYWSHFATSVLHTNYVDSVAFYGDLILSKAAKEHRIVLWRIDGFSSDLADMLAQSNAPTSHDRTKDSLSAFGDGFTRLAQFNIPNTTPWYMRFGIGHSIAGPILVMGNDAAKVYVFELKDFELNNSDDDVFYEDGNSDTSDDDDEDDADEADNDNGSEQEESESEVKRNQLPRPPTSKPGLHFAFKKAAWIATSLPSAIRDDDDSDIIENFDDNDDDDEDDNEDDDEEDNEDKQDDREKPDAVVPARQYKRRRSGAKSWETLKISQRRAKRRLRYQRDKNTKRIQEAVAVAVADADAADTAADRHQALPEGDALDVYERPDSEEYDYTLEVSAVTDHDDDNAMISRVASKKAAGDVISSDDKEAVNHRARSAAMRASIPETTDEDEYINESQPLSEDVESVNGFDPMDKDTLSNSQPQTRKSAADSAVLLTPSARTKVSHSRYSTPQWQTKPSLSPSLPPTSIELQAYIRSRSVSSSRFNLPSAAVLPAEDTPLTRSRRSLTSSPSTHSPKSTHRKLSSATQPLTASAANSTNRKPYTPTGSSAIADPFQFVKPHSTLDIPRIKRLVRHLAFSPHGDYLAACGDGGFVCVWKVHGGE